MNAAPPPEPRGEKIKGWKAIASRLQIHEDTARAYARLADDPLPLRTNKNNRAEPWCYSLFLDQWKARRCGGILPDGTELARFVGWEAIRAMLGGTPLDTVRRWSRRRHDPLPVIRRGRAEPWAYHAAIRDWIQRGDVPFAAHDGAETENPSRPKGWIPVRGIALGNQGSSRVDAQPARSYAILKRPIQASSRGPAEESGPLFPSVEKSPARTPQARCPS